MKHILFILFVGALLVACDNISSVSRGITENPFIDAIDLETSSWVVSPSATDGVLDVTEGADTNPYDGSGVIRFPVVADVQMYRASISPITWYREEFTAWLKANDFPFLVNLGDIIDHGPLTDPGLLSFYAETANAVNGNHILCIGNHELYDNTTADFDRLFSREHEGRNARMVRYEYGPLSIYKLDNSKRSFGYDQLEWLEEALKVDPNPYRILIAHEVISAGNDAGQTIATFGMDPKEQNRLFRIMSENGVSLILTGHYHKGMVFRHRDDLVEFTASSLHEKNANGLESKGHWYVVEVDTINDEIRIIDYNALTSEPAGEPYIIKLCKLYN